MIKAIVFDFDGVIVDSSGIKFDAWFSVFNDLTISDDLVRGVLSQFGKETRFVIVEKVLKEAGIEDLGGELKQKYSQIYGETTQAKILQEGVKKETLVALRELKEKYFLAIASGTPIEPLKAIARDLGIADLFDEIFGKPQTKEGAVGCVIRKKGLKPEEILFVGDDPIDLQAATNTGCWFVGIANRMNGWEKGKEDFHVIGEFSEIVDCAASF